MLLTVDLRLENCFTIDSDLRLAFQLTVAGGRMQRGPSQPVTLYLKAEGRARVYIWARHEINAIDAIVRRDKRVYI